MKILHIVEDFSPNAYGLYTSLSNILSMFKGTNIKMEVLYPPKVKNPWRYSLEFKYKLLNNIKFFDIIHIHGIWLYPQYISAKLALKYEIPFILSPRGMLNKVTLDRKNNNIIKILKKKLYLKMISNIFKKAAKIHALTIMEKDNISRFFPAEKIVVIPNAINTDEIDKCIQGQNLLNNSERYILFIGRLDPIKGVDLLIKAFNSLSNGGRNWKLKITGPEWNRKYVSYIKDIAKRNKNIEFLGKIEGCEKFKLLYNAWVVVIPSISEGFPSVALEAAACYTPIITTYNVGLHDWHYKCGNLIVENSIIDIKKALEKAISWSFSERINLGIQARRYVEKNFSIESVRKLWINLYRAVLKEGIS